jgi:hypothetical protein
MSTGLSLDAVYAANACRDRLGTLSHKSRIAVLKILLREATEAAKEPEPPDPRQAPLFPEKT